METYLDDCGVVCLGIGMEYVCMESNNHLGVAVGDKVVLRNTMMDGCWCVSDVFACSLDEWNATFKLSWV
jgi:hypothetical protein